MRTAGLPSLVVRFSRVVGALAILGGGCSDSTAPPAPVAAVTLDAAGPLDLVPGATKMVVAIPKDASGTTLSDRSTAWTSSDLSKVTVAAGLITGVAVGEATVTASVEGQVATLNVRVNEGAVVGPAGSSFSVFSGAVTVAVPAGAVAQPMSVTVSRPGSPPSSRRLVTGSAFELGPAAVNFSQPVSLSVGYDPSAIPEGNSETELQLYEVVSGIWRVVDGSTARSDTKLITATVGRTGVFAVMTRPRVETISIGGDLSTMTALATRQLTATLRDSDQTPANATVTWSSSNADVVSIDPATGNVTAKRPGTATITASAAGKSGTASLTVIAGPPAKLVAWAGNNQAVATGAAVPLPPSVIVTDAADNPIANVPVTFAVTAGGGSIAGAAAVTNASGIAQVASWTLGPSAGTNTLVATSTAVSGVTITFNATGLVGAIAGYAGNNQIARPGSPVPTAPSVIVTDPAGNPVSGATVSFEVIAGGGSVSGPVASTNADGIAAVGAWTLGTSPGTNTIRASSPGLNGSPVIFNAEARLATATAITLVAGDNQTGEPGSALAVSPAVKVTDETGAPMGGVQVNFTVTAGGGNISGSSATTGSDGIATAGTWTLGPSSGANTLVASSPVLSGQTVIFNASAGPPPPARIQGSDGEGQTASVGAFIPIPPSVLVTDAAGNPAPGVAVTFSIGLGGGTVTGSNSVTDQFGIARVAAWRLGPIAGHQTLHATAPGLTGSPVIFNAQATPLSASAMSIIAGNNQTARPGTAVPVAPSVRVTDASGTPIAGITVTFAVTAGSGSLTGSSVTTNADGIATVGSWTLGPQPGANELSVAAAGVSLTISATAALPGAATIAINAGNNQNGIAGQPVPIPPSVRITDSEGAPASGVTVTFAIVSGGGAITGASAVSNASGIATVGSWTLGVGGNSLSASAPGLNGDPITFVAVGATEVQIVTFGDSNTDLGFSGTNPVAQVASYVSSANPSIKLSAGSPHSPLQLAGKIESRWRANTPRSIRVVNHGIAGTRSGSGRTVVGAPNALEQVDGVSRFRGEVMGDAYPWSGGEPGNEFYPSGAISRTQSFTPRTSDFVYVSLGTNDIGSGVAPATVAANLASMINEWVSRGLPANRFFITTIPPRNPAEGVGANIVDLNSRIRALASASGVRLIDLSTFVSSDDGITWKPGMSLSGDPLHYSEAVRNWLADQVVSLMLSF